MRRGIIEEGRDEMYIIKITFGENSRDSVGNVEVPLDNTYHNFIHGDMTRRWKH